MKKFLKVIYSLIKIIILCIPFVLDYFGKNKMGMHRYLIAKSYNLRNAIFIPQNILLIKVAAVLIFIVAVIFAAGRNKRAYVLLLSSAAFTAIVFSSKIISLKVYYFYLICFGAVAVLCLADMLIGFMVENRKKDK